MTTNNRIWEEEPDDERTEIFQQKRIVSHRYHINNL